MGHFIIFINCYWALTLIWACCQHKQNIISLYATLSHINNKLRQTRWAGSILDILHNEHHGRGDKESKESKESDESNERNVVDESAVEIQGCITDCKKISLPLVTLSWNYELIFMQKSYHVTWSDNFSPWFFILACTNTFTHVKWSLLWKRP